MPRLIDATTALLDTGEVVHLRYPCEVDTPLFEAQLATADAEYASMAADAIALARKAQLQRLEAEQDALAAEQAARTVIPEVWRRGMGEEVGE